MSGVPLLLLVILETYAGKEEIYLGPKLTDSQQMRSTGIRPTVWILIGGSGVESGRMKGVSLNEIFNHANGMRFTVFALKQIDPG